MQLQPPSQSTQVLPGPEGRRPQAACKHGDHEEEPQVCEAEDRLRSGQATD